TGFLPADLGLVEFQHKSFKIRISSPATVQELLAACTSVKVKRLFLYLADKAGHQWLSFLDTKKLDLGSGKRVIVPNGQYVSKYRITVPRELEALN
ncbi:MAG: type IV toxin-antitoxin system AbiEi family antitoxin domain-containing protein, partial [Pseudomonadales bacterium]